MPVGTPLSACCKNRRSLPCAEVDGCIKGISRIAGLMGLIPATIIGGDVGLDEPGASAVSLLRENLLEKGCQRGVRDGTS